MHKLTHERLLELLDYSRDTGVFVWKVWRNPKRPAGSFAGNWSMRYLRIAIGGELFLAHRLAWFYVHGRWPADEVDHIDRNPRNNAITNLREATRATNGRNVSRRSDNSSGNVGIVWCEQRQKWQAQIHVAGKNIHLGRFSEKSAAENARIQAEAKYFGEFAPIRIVVAFFFIALVCVFVSTPSEARVRAPAIHKDCNIIFPCDLRNHVQSTKREQKRRDRGQRIERAMPFGRATQKKPVTKQAEKLKTAPTIAGYIQKTVTAVGVSLVGVVDPLAAKAREIQEACGSKVISAVRRTYIRGTRRISLHASGQAVDMAGNPDCMYERLKGWQGGYSTDYARMKHIHISHSEGGREWGARFAHGGRAIRRSRYASAARD